LNKFIHPCQSK